MKLAYLDCFSGISGDMLLGAWIACVAMAALFVLMKGIRRHYDSVARELHATATARSLQFVDAPVSGGVSRAKTGELSIMVGGTEANIARAMPVLKAMGTTITRCGDVGAGQAMKALNNLVSAGGFLIGTLGMGAGHVVDAHAATAPAPTPIARSGLVRRLLRTPLARNRAALVGLALAYSTRRD